MFFDPPLHNLNDNEHEMNMNPSGTRRARQSSSDSEIQNPPKKHMMSSSHDAGRNGGPKGEDLTLADVMSSLADLRENQDVLRTSMEKRLDTIEKRFKSQIENSMRDLRENLYKDMEGMNQRIAEIENKLSNFHEASLSDDTEPPHLGTGSGFHAKYKLIVKNIPETENETVETLTQTVSEILQLIEVNDEITDVSRIVFTTPPILRRSIHHWDSQEKPTPLQLYSALYPRSIEMQFCVIKYA